jgi:hypothetical protein
MKTVSLFGWILPVIPIIFGIIGIVKDESKRKASAGIILGIIGLIVGVLIRFLIATLIQ